MSKSNKLVFVGTGGGGAMVASQKLVTGGTYVEIGDTRLYVDPGPGALLRSRQLGVPIETLDAILLTHQHLDHSHDIPVILEAWRNLDEPQTTPGKKWIFAPSDYYNDRPFPAFLNKKYDKAIKVTGQQEYSINSVTIRTSKPLIEKPFYKDNLPEVYGYWLQSGTIDIGFWSQSQYQPGITDGFRPKILIMDFWDFEPEPWEFQKNILLEMKPEKIIIRHIIKRIFEQGLDSVAKKIEDETGIETQIAPEGGTIEIN